MKFSAQDWPRLRWSIIVLVLCLILGVVLYFLLQNHIKTLAQTQKQLASQQMELRSQLTRAREEEQEIRQRIAQYQRLVSGGLLIEEDRLNWVESIARIKAARRLIDVQYELSPRHALDAALLPGGGDIGPYQFMASTMTLKLALLHEEDLLGLIGDLKKTVSAELLVRSCQMERSASAVKPVTGPAPNLQATCMIDWVTLREKKS